MKLYKIATAPPGERWLSHKTGLRNFDEVELPREGRQGMAQFLNANELEVSAPPAGPVEGPISTHGQPFDPLQVAELRAVAAARGEPFLGDKPIGYGMLTQEDFDKAHQRELTADTVIAFILDDATVAQAGHILEALGTRLKEHVNGAR